MPFYRACLHERCTIFAQKPHGKIIAQRACNGENKGKGGVWMNKLIARLIDCGMTREVAQGKIRMDRAAFRPKNS